jgi:hypothetical protein
VETIESAVLADGRVEKLGPSPLVVRNYHGDSVIPVRLEGMNPRGRLDIYFDTDSWRFPITFPSGAISLSGLTVGLSFASDLYPFFENNIDSSQMIGRTFKIFDWTGVTLLDQFAAVNGMPYEWDTSRLYTDGTVTLIAVPEPSMLMTFLVGLAIAASKSRRCARRGPPIVGEAMGCAACGKIAVNA